MNTGGHFNEKGSRLRTNNWRSQKTARKTQNRHKKLFRKERTIHWVKWPFLGGVRKETLWLITCNPCISQHESRSCSWQGGILISVVWSRGWERERWRAQTCVPLEAMLLLIKTQEREASKVVLSFSNVATLPYSSSCWGDPNHTFVFVATS